MSWRLVDLKRKGKWALIIVGIMIVSIFLGYHINKWSQLKVREGDFLSDVEWKPNGSYALVVGGYYKWVKSPDIEFVKPSDTPSSSWELHEVRGKIWRYEGTNLTEYMSWDDEEYGYPLEISWAPNGNYALIRTDNGIYKYDDVQNSLTLVTSEDIRYIEYFWWPESSNVFFFDPEYARGQFLAFYDGNKIKIFNTIDLRLKALALEPKGVRALIFANDRKDNRMIMEFNGSRFETIWSSKTHEVDIIEWSISGDFALIYATGDFPFSQHLLKYDGMNVTLLLDYENQIIPPIGIRSISRRPGTDEFYILYGDLMRVLINDTIVREIEYSDDYENEFHWEPQGNSAFLVGHSSIQFFDGENISPLPVNISWLRWVLWEPNGNYALLSGYNDTFSPSLWKYQNGSFTLVYNDVRLGFPISKGTFKPDGGNFLTPRNIDERYSCFLEYDGNNVDIIIKGVAFEKDAVNWWFWERYVVTIVLVILILLFLMRRYGFSDGTGHESVPDKDTSNEKGSQDTDEESFISDDTKNDEA
jgi:hypothetical protein